MAPGQYLGFTDHWMPYLLTVYCILSFTCFKGQYLAILQSQNPSWSCSSWQFCKLQCVQLSLTSAYIYPYHPHPYQCNVIINIKSERPDTISFKFNNLIIKSPNQSNCPCFTSFHPPPPKEKLLSIQLLSKQGFSPSVFPFFFLYYINNLYFVRC